MNFNSVQPDQMQQFLSMMQKQQFTGSSTPTPDQLLLIQQLQTAAASAPTAPTEDAGGNSNLSFLSAGQDAAMRTSYEVPATISSASTKKTTKRVNSGNKAKSKHADKNLLSS